MAPLERALMKQVKGVFAGITATILIVALPLLVADLVTFCFSLCGDFALVVLE